ncbi:MAG: hypothetical protein ACKVU1_01635 [bacterium]
MPADAKNPPHETPPRAAGRRGALALAFSDSRARLCVLLAAVCALVYGASALQHAAGEWTAPLDDAYIYYQYAKSFVSGSPFAYAPGEPATTGATSLLHLILLAPWFLLGVSGSGAVVVTFLGGAAALAATLVLLHDLLEKRASREMALWGVLLFAASGPLAWGYFSGMELPLLHLFFVASLHALLTPVSTRRRVAVLCGLALCRPEGFLFPVTLLVCAAGAAVLAHRARGAGAGASADDRDSSPAPLSLRALAIPVAVGALPFLLALVLTGTLSSQSMRAKALLFEGSTTTGELIARGAAYFAVVLKGVFGEGASEPTGALSANRWQVATFFPPLALPLFLLGLLPDAAEEARRRRPALFLPAALWFFGALLLESALLPYPSHWNRYTMPFFPLFLVGAVFGAHRLAGWLGEARSGLSAARGLLAFFLLFSIVGWAQLAVGFGRNARDIHDQHVNAGRWIAANLPPASRIAVNDAGALAYFGGRPILDLLGLVSRGTTEPVNEGAGALYEYLESLPAASRPTHFAVYPDWFRLADAGIFGATIYTAPLFAPSIAGSPLPLTIYVADWSLAGSGAQPLAVPPGWRVVDALDVADLASEHAHGYRFRRPGPGYPESDALSLHYAGDGAPRVADGGRLIAGGERFRTTASASQDLLLVARTDGAFRLDVKVNGASAGTWNHNGPSGVWSEAGFPIPAAAVRGGAVEFEIDTPPALGARSYRVFHYWVCQRG